MAVEMKLGGQIREHREAMGLSQDDLAGRIFVSRQTVSNWETGHTYPDVQNLLLLGNLFGITLDELVKGDVGKMDEKIERNRRGIIVLSVAETILAVLTWALAVVAAPGILKDTSGSWVWMNFIYGILALLAVEFVVHVYRYKLRKDADVITYRELQAYLRGDEVDRSQRKHGPVSVRRFVVLMLIGMVFFAIIGAAVGYGLMWLLVWAGIVAA